MWLKNKNRMMDCIAILLFFVIPSLIYHDAIFRNDLMVYGDGMSSYAAKIFQYKEVAKGELPLWNSYVIAGSPFYAESQNTFFYPFNALALFFPPTLFTNIYYILHIGFAGLFTYLFLKQTSGSRMTAFVGGIVFALSTCIGGFRKEHVTVFTSIIWLPLILYFLSLFIYHRKQRYLIFSAFAMMLQFFGGHPQFTFYSDIVAVAYLIYFMIVSKRAFLEILKSLLILGSAFILFSAIALVPLAELMLQSSRGAANYFSLFSPSWRLLLMLIFPKVFGDIFYPLGIYGSAEISIELYLGIIPLVYVLYAVRYYFNNHLIRFSIIAIFIAYLYASIPHIPYVRDVVQKIPILGYFGVQSRTLFIYVFFSIICFSYGVSDLNNPENLKRLNRHNFMMTILITLCALTIIAIGQSIPTEKPWSLFSLISSEVFSVSIVIALFNYLLVKSLSLFRYNQKFYAYASVTIGFILLFITGLDVGRFSSMRVETNYDTLLKTDETVSLKQLLQNEPYRILPIYDQYYEPVHNKSGLVDNWSLFNNIRNIKGWTEFENPHLNELFDQVETRDPTNIRRLISESGLISMLSVKYILSPIDQQFPKALPKIPESVLINRNSLIQIPGDGSLFVDSTPISLESKRYYRIELIVETPSTDIQEFFVDFYNGPEYDKIEQEKHFSLDSGEHTYKTVLYSGDDPLPQGGDSFRVISITNVPITIKNLQVIKLVPPIENPNYILADQTSNYEIYENTQAQKLLYIPEQTISIESDAALRKSPEDYPRTDRISYIKGFKNLKTDGNIEILKVKNNSLQGRVISQRGTFVNHAQAYYPGWKAYIDGKPVPIYLVNGLIQGVEVPPGTHIVDFVFDPSSLKIGAAISAVAILIASAMVFMEEYHTKKFGKEQQYQSTEHEEFD